MMRLASRHGQRKIELQSPDKANDLLRQFVQANPSLLEKRQTGSQHKKTVPEVPLVAQAAYIALVFGC